MHQQVVGPAQLVGPDGLQVLPLEVDLRAGDLGEPIAELQWADGDHAGNSLRCLIHISGGQRRSAVIQIGGHRIMVPPPELSRKTGRIGPIHHIRSFGCPNSGMRVIVDR